MSIMNVADQLENVKSFRSLVDRFNFRRPPIDKVKASMARNADTIITARIRPLLTHEAEGGQTEGTVRRNEHMVDLHGMTLGLPGGPKLRSSEFYLDKVYGPNTSTEEIYEQVAKPLVELALEGGIGTLFAYGQTGSGKTFTVDGVEKIVANVLLEKMEAGGKQIMVQIFELGSTLNSAFDLLNNRKPVQVLEDSFGETRIVGGVEPRVHDPQEFIDLIDKAAQFRKTQTTEKNEFSSRSHAVCRITITDPDTPAAQDGILYLVDLAGSEAARDSTYHDTDRMKETKDINNSLSVLKDCIRGRAQYDPNKKPYIPFRQSVLSKTLKHLFDPAVGRVCKMSVIACINPSFLDIGPSKNTLRYAEMLRVPVPMSRALKYDAKNPSTWSNEQARKWITENSGDPSVDATLVATYHSGLQLIKMDEEEFVQRCRKTEGVSKEQAHAFRSKLWQMHVDANRPKAHTKKTYDPYKESSQVPPEIAKIPFKQRIRPGMVVRYKPEKPVPYISMALVSCPDWAIETDVSDYKGKKVEGVKGEGPRRYLCSMVGPAVMQDSYQLNAWRQIVLNVDDMEAEVFLEFDPATRFYFISV